MLAILATVIHTAEMRAPAIYTGRRWGAARCVDLRRRGRGTMSAWQGGQQTNTRSAGACGRDNARGQHSAAQPHNSGAQHGAPYKGAVRPGGEGGEGGECPAGASAPLPNRVPRRDVEGTERPAQRPHRPSLLARRAPRPSQGNAIHRRSPVAQRNTQHSAQRRGPWQVCSTDVTSWNWRGGRAGRAGFLCGGARRGRGRAFLAIFTLLRGFSGVSRGGPGSGAALIYRLAPRRVPVGATNDRREEMGGGDRRPWGHPAPTAHRY